MKKKENHSFFHSIVILTSGSVIAQLLTVISAPFITRLFTPNDIGAYTYILTISFLFMGIINGRYDMSIVTEQDEKNVFALIKLSLVICLYSAVLLSVLYTLYIVSFSDNPLNYNYSGIFLFILLMSYGIINILNAYNNRYKEYKLMSSLYIVRSGFQNLGAVVFGFFDSGMLGLLIPYLIGQIMGLRRQAKSLTPHFSTIKNITRGHLVEVAKIHYRQPVYSVPAVFLNNFSYNSITFFIQALFGMSSVGFYSISVRILGLPLSVVSGNVSRVFFGDASKEYEKTGQFYTSFRRTSIFLALLAIPMVLAMIFIVPPLTNILFGDGWKEAGIYIKTLATMFGLRFVVSSLTPGILINNNQKYELTIQTLFVIFSIFSYIITKIMSLNIVEYLSIINISFSIIYILYFIVLYKCSKKQNRSEK